MGSAVKRKEISWDFRTNIQLLMQRHVSFTWYIGMLCINLTIFWSWKLNGQTLRSTTVEVTHKDCFSIHFVCLPIMRGVGYFNIHNQQKTEYIRAMPPNIEYISNTANIIHIYFICLFSLKITEGLVLNCKFH